MSASRNFAAAARRSAHGGVTISAVSLDDLEVGTSRSLRGQDGPVASQPAPLAAHVQEADPQWPLAAHAPPEPGR